MPSHFIFMLRLEKSASKRRRSPRKSRRRAGSPGKCAGSSPPTSRRHAHSDTGHKTIRSTADRSAARTKARSSRHIPCRPLPLFSSQYSGFPRRRQGEKGFAHAARPSSYGFFTKAWPPAAFCFVYLSSIFDCSKYLCILSLTLLYIYV